MLLLADLGTAPELLAAGGGHTYRSGAELRDLLDRPAPRGVLPPRFDWDRAAADTLEVYRAATRRAAAATARPTATPAASSAAPVAAPA